MKHEAVTPEYRYQIERRRDYSERIENGGRAVRLVDEPAKDEPWDLMSALIACVIGIFIAGVIAIYAVGQ